MTAGANATTVVQAFDMPNPESDGALQHAHRYDRRAGQFHQFRFQRADVSTSFAVADDVVSFTAPNGTNLKPQITGFSWTDSETLHITFTAQSAVGTYTMVIGPQILAADNGNPDGPGQRRNAGRSARRRVHRHVQPRFDDFPQHPGHQPRLDHDGRRAVGFRTSHRRRRHRHTAIPTPPTATPAATSIGVNLSATTARPWAGPTT